MRILALFVAWALAGCGGKGGETKKEEPFCTYQERQMMVREFAYGGKENLRLVWENPEGKFGHHSNISFYASHQWVARNENEEVVEGTFTVEDTGLTLTVKDSEGEWTTRYEATCYKEGPFSRALTRHDSENKVFWHITDQAGNIQF